ncbi:MAG: DUF4878 domain-containing protein [Prevotella sp.]|nr:DUF4878 domain-containing protein [Prevotella sp.]
MKKLFLSMSVAVATLVLWSCGASNTPSGVAEKAIECLQNEDYEGYVDLIHFKGEDDKDYDEAKMKEGKEQFAALLKEKGKKTMDKKGGIKSYEVVSEEISEDGNSAKVTMKTVYGDGTEDSNKMKLVKNSKGEWKISMNK